MRKFKKYLWFTPLALDYYFIIIWACMEQTTSSEWWFEVFFYSWQMFQVVVYFIALYRLVKSDEYDARSAAKVAVYVKLPQILPVVLLAVFSILCLIVPVTGIFVSIALWTRLIFTFIATSIVVMVACIKMAKTRTFSSGIAVVFSILSFIPVLEYIVPLILLGVSKRNRKPPVSGMYGQNGSMKYGTAPNMYGQNMLPQNGAAPNMYGQNMLPQNGAAPDMYGQNPPMQYGPAPNMYGQNPPMQYGPAPNTYGQNPPMQYGPAPNMYGQNPPMQYEPTTDMSGQNIVVQEEPSQDMI